MQSNMDTHHKNRFFFYGYIKSYGQKKGLPEEAHLEAEENETCKKSILTCLSYHNEMKNTRPYGKPDTKWYPVFHGVNE